MSEESRKKMRQRQLERRRRQRRRRRIKVAVERLALFILLAVAILFMTSALLKVRRRENLQALSLPDWCQEAYLPVNPYSRPGTERTKVKNIVVHYVANPGTTARENRNYFAGMADAPESERRSVSSHFIIGLEGEILCCVPVQEVAYANYPRNEDTISIECCHPDNSGKFTQETQKSLVKLVSWLCSSLDLKASDVIRHYDVSGKNCPKYYVEHEDAWTTLKSEIADQIK